MKRAARVNPDLNRCSANAPRRVRLGEVVTIKARIGWQGLTRKEHLDTGVYYLITGTDFDDGNVDFERCKYVAKERFDQDSNIQIRNGDILITKDGTIGKVALVQGLNKCATLNSGVFVLRRLIEDVELRYLYHFFYGPEFRRLVDQSLTGCTIPHLNQAKLVNFMFPLPPLAVQRKIAAELDRICALKRTAEKTVEKLRVLVKTRFVEMFGDGQTGTNKFPVRRLDEVCESMSAGNDVPVDYVKTADDRHQVPIYSNGIENSGLYGYATEARIYKPCVTISARGTIGWVCRRMKPFVPIIRLVVAVPRIDLIDVIYLESALRDQCAINTGTTIPQLPVPAARKIRVMLPPLPLQHEFAAFVAKVEKLEAAAKRAAERLDVLYRAKLQEYFA